MFKQFIVACLIFMSTNAFAGWIMKDEKGNVVHLHDSPCKTTKGVFAEMPVELRAQAKSATILWNKKRYEGCWVDQGDRFAIVDESGDGGVLPKAVFKEELGV